jgi:hypothetical protein
MHVRVAERKIADLLVLWIFLIWSFRQEGILQTYLKDEIGKLIDHKDSQNTQRASKTAVATLTAFCDERETTTKSV